jgi:hypothetical protein
MALIFLSYFHGYNKNEIFICRLLRHIQTVYKRMWDRRGLWNLNLPPPLNTSITAKYSQQKVNFRRPALLFLAFLVYLFLKEKLLVKLDNFRWCYKGNVFICFDIENQHNFITSQIF